MEILHRKSILLLVYLILFVLFIALLTIAFSLIPEIIASDVEAWLEENWGTQYKT